MLSPIEELIAKPDSSAQPLLSSRLAEQALYKLGTGEEPLPF